MNSSQGAGLRSERNWCMDVHTQKSPNDETNCEWDIRFSFSNPGIAEQVYIAFAAGHSIQENKQNAKIITLLVVQQPQLTAFVTEMRKECSEKSYRSEVNAQHIKPKRRRQRVGCGKACSYPIWWSRQEWRRSELKIKSGNYLTPDRRIFDRLRAKLPQIVTMQIRHTKTTNQKHYLKPYWIMGASAWSSLSNLVVLSRDLACLIKRLIPHLISPFATLSWSNVRPRPELTRTHPRLSSAICLHLPC